MSFTKRGLFGLVLMAVGTVLFYPAALPSSTEFLQALLAVAAVFLAGGTYLVGTDVSGPVA